jgi:hypothetical protein
MNPSPTSSEQVLFLRPNRLPGVRRLRGVSSLAAVVLLAFTILVPRLAPAGEDAAQSETRLAEAVRLLASDEMEGRAAGSKGLELAAGYISTQFAQLGLKTDLYAGTPFQEFKMTMLVETGPKEKNRMAWAGPSANGAESKKIDLVLGQDFTPLAVSGSNAFDSPLVFAGYGITGQGEKYDDYAGIDVRGKAVILLRHEPQQSNPASVFNGSQDSVHALLTRKISNAREHGAAAVILCTDVHEIEARIARAQKAWLDAIDRLVAEQAKFKQTASPTTSQVEEHRKKVGEMTKQIEAAGKRLDAERDPVMDFRGGGSDGGNDRLPVAHCRRAAVDQALKAATGTDLAALEREIDQGPTPRSRELPGWRAIGETSLQRQEAQAKNVIAVLPGEGPLAEETIVIGGHYDHVGRGRPGAQGPESQAICNGADDNASGIAVLIEVARRLKAEQPRLPRRIVFAAFAGEERGLLGSKHYTDAPLFPLAGTIAMLNLDMVGRLKDDKLMVFGTSTAAEFSPLLDKLNAKCAFQLTKSPQGFGGSDHMPFHARQIPVLHFYTGMHPDYHRPSDDADKVNPAGMRRISEMVAELAIALARGDQRPHFTTQAEAPPGFERR